MLWYSVARDHVGMEVFFSDGNNVPSMLLGILLFSSVVGLVIVTWDYVFRK
jgi:hypothetical protein